MTDIKNFLENRKYVDGSDCIYLLKTSGDDNFKYNIDKVKINNLKDRVKNISNIIFLIYEKNSNELFCNLQKEINKVFQLNQTGRYFNCDNIDEVIKIFINVYQNYKNISIIENKEILLIQYENKINKIINDLNIEFNEEYNRLTKDFNKEIYEVNKNFNDEIKKINILNTKMENIIINQQEEINILKNKLKEYEK